MNLLFRVIYANGCRSTHHKIALDALRHLHGAQASDWSRLFLKYNATFLHGAKRPDTEFKDFRNHVLHVSDNYWGGALKASRKWYDETLAALHKRDWARAVHNAGILSHYYSDPIMPFHTGQSEAENNIHRAAEWSITKSYDSLIAMIDERGAWPEIQVPRGSDWLENMVLDGAELGHAQYDTLLQNYDLDRGVKDPPAGLDSTCRRALAPLLAHAVMGFSAILKRAIDEADVEPPETSLSLQGFLATVSVPIRWVTNKMADASERRLVEAMYAELKKTGKVEKTLPADDRQVREAFATEMGTSSASERSTVTKKATKKASASKPKPTSKPMATGAPKKKQPKANNLRFYLHPSDHVEDAPSIGSKTADRLQSAGVRTVADLLSADPEAVSSRLKVRYVTPEVVEEWQDQALLVCCIPKLRGHDAQILVACDYRTPEAVAAADADEILDVVEPFCETSAGKRILRSSQMPDYDEVCNWISWAGQSRPYKAA